MASDDGRGGILRMVEGRELSAVTFVRDYLQLHFDGPFLNAYVWPVVVLPDAVPYSAATRGYRDKLCARIGCAVLSASETKDHIAISFADDSLFRISLRDEDRSGPEAAVLDDGSGQRWNTW